MEGTERFEAMRGMAAGLEAAVRKAVGRAAQFIINIAKAR